MTRVSTRSRHSLRREITTAFSAAILVLGACMTVATQYALRHALSESGLPEGVQDHLGQHLIYTLTGLAIVGTAFGLVVTGILSRMITQPVRRLVQAVERMDAVNLDTVLDTSGSREFGLLADAFNGMTARLKKAHESLESQVEQRTAELASTNATLLFEISLRKKAEKRLAYLATFPERNPSPVLEVDWNGSVRYANPAARDLFPDICERQSEHPWLADWAGVMRMVQEQDPATATRDLAIDGRSYQQLFYHFPQDKFVRIYGLDITDRKKAEGQQTELLRKLSETNRQLQDFAYVVSHDLKAPLRGIRTLVDWLGADYADKLDEQGRENLALLDNRAGRMQSLIDGILQYSRVGRTEQGVESVDLSRLLPEILDALDAPSHIAVSIETELPTVEGDVTRITQVFQNLLSNAIKYMDKPQGRISVACAEDEGFWRFSVSDNGPGVEAKYFDRIFKLFQTLGNAAGSESSTGIGLALVKRIVEMYGGRVWVESEVGRGSTFLFTLPRSRAPAASSPPLEEMCQLVS